MDIEQQEFSRSFRGYNEEEVDEFLDKIVKDYEELIKENERLKDEVERLKENLKKFSELEETLKSAALNAHKTAEEIKEKVENERKTIIEKAKVEAELIKQQALQKEDEIRNEIDSLKRYKFMFKEKIKSMLNLYLKMLENEEFEEVGEFEWNNKNMDKYSKRFKELNNETDIPFEKQEQGDSK